MYDFIYRRKRLVQLVLALISLPFAFFGVDYYFRNSSGAAGEVASVAGEKVTREEFQDGLRQQQERMRQALGANFDPATFDTPEMRYSVLEQMIGQKLLRREARRDRLTVSDDQLRSFIADIPAFQENGKFSQSRYEQLLDMQNPRRTPAQFAEELRRDLVLAPLQEPIVGGSIVARSNVERYLDLLEQQREVAIATVDVDPFLKEVKIDDAEVKQYYDGNQGAFQTPEEVKLDYVKLTPDALAAEVTVDPADVRKQYDANPRNYGKPEERQASHILIAVKPDATAAEQDAAKKKAEEIAAEARKSPAQFAELAKKYSQDPGSASQGGDLGFFSRDGSMVKPFEDAVFSMKAGEVSEPIKTNFGWHVIKLTEVRPAKMQSFDEVKAQIEQDLKRQRASAKFADAADQMQNLVYEQADSLAPVAKALDLKVESTPLLSRAQVLALAQNNQKFVQAVFSPDSLQAKRNTDAIEVAPNTLMAARVVEYKPAAPRPFDEVKAEIRRQLEQKAAGERAQAAGKAKLEQLQQGKEVDVAFGKPVTVARSQPRPGVPAGALAAIFQVDASKLPAYTGATNERGGYSLYRVQRIIAPPPPDAAKVNAFAGRIGDQLGRELVAEYVAGLRAKADIKINDAAIEADLSQQQPPPGANPPQRPQRRR
ncbi:MAG TPA: SurA N-terminal domain-containing protein [Casimicrobiaceae bacterium]|nr:SurA N-terminal domain-containing protein [Casimicrobiaceae bacterium]